MVPKGPAHKYVTRFDHREFKVTIGADNAGGYRALARSAKGDEVATIDGKTQGEVTDAIKATLNELSEQFVGFGGATNLFLKAFPEGFETQLFVEQERNYKRAARDPIRETLSAAFIDEAVESGGELEELARRVVAALQKTNLVSPFEKARFNDAMKKAAFRRSYAPVLGEILHGDFDNAFAEQVRLLKDADALTWPLATYFPFLSDPQRHMFMKPEIMKLCAHRLGFELHYETPPTLESYRSLLAFTDYVRQGIASLSPEDNIDIQSFTYVIGAPGYVREATARREQGS